MLRVFISAVFLASTFAALAQAPATAQTPPPATSDPPSNLYLVATPGQILLVSQFNTLTACAAAAANWRYNQIIGVQANSVTGTWIGLICAPTR
jgi:hypothetical protein